MQSKNMSIGNFRCRLADSVTELTTNPEKIKCRLENAILNHLLLANVTDCEEIPQYFRDQHRGIITQVSTKTRCGQNGVRASLEGRHGKTLAKLATEILKLHRDFEEYINNGFIPEKGA